MARLTAEWVQETPVPIPGFSLYILKEWSEWAGAGTWPPSPPPYPTPTTTALYAQLYPPATMTVVVAPWSILAPRLVGDSGLVLLVHPVEDRRPLIHVGSPRVAGNFRLLLC